MVLFSDLKLRTISSLILFFISLSALIMGGIYFDLLITLISIVLSFEWMRIVSNNYWIIRGIISSLGLILILTNNSLLKHIKSSKLPPPRVITIKS